MHEWMGPLRAALADPNAFGYLIFGAAVFLMVLMFLHLISMGFGKPDVQEAAVRTRDRHRTMRYFTEKR
jgi:hypothetical protein